MQTIRPCMWEFTERCDRCNKVLRDFKGETFEAFEHAMGLTFKWLTDHGFKRVPREPGKHQITACHPCAETLRIEAQLRDNNQEDNDE